MPVPTALPCAPVWPATWQVTVVFSGYSVVLLRVGLTFLKYVEEPFVFPRLCVVLPRWSSWRSVSHQLPPALQDLPVFLGCFPSLAFTLLTVFFASQGFVLMVLNFFLSGFWNLVQSSDFFTRRQ